MPSKGGKNNKPKPKNMKKCTMCKSVGHELGWCPNKMKFAKSKCSLCKGTGHPQSACTNHRS